MRKLLAAGFGLAFLLGIAVAWAAGPYFVSATQATACVAINAEPTAASNGQYLAHDCSLTGKTIILPWANTENFVSGAGNTTGTGATTIISAPGSGIKLHVVSAQCGRTDAGTTAVTATLNDSASTVIVIPDSGGGGGNNPRFDPPLSVASNTALTFTMSSGVTTAYCSAQAYKGV